MSGSRADHPSPVEAARDFLGLNRNIAVLAMSIFGLGLGEELWQAFLPKYLAALGATGLVVGLFSSCKDLLDSLCQYPGGWFNDRFGRKRALTAMTLAAMAGYAVYALATHWAVAFAGLLLVMAWKSGAFPTTFAVIGDALPKGRRAIAFSVQSILVRVPRVIGAPIGGLLIVTLGVVTGVRVALCATLVIAIGVVLTQRRAFREDESPGSAEADRNARQVWAAMRPELKCLLLADILVRVGEGLAAAFIVLYVTGDLRVSAAAFGLLYAIQQAIAILLYLPMGKVADMAGRRPMVALTFVFFALFPVAVGIAHSYGGLVLAFVLGGLKEMGEPARKSLIVDLSDAAHCGRSVGVYYGVRNMTVVPAGAIGRLLWQQAHRLPLMAAGVVGILGVVSYLVLTRGDRSEMGDA
jgi:MFS family permease